jgi:predicted lipoprotein
MNKKLIRYIVFVIFAGLLLYNSVYFKKLDAKTAAIETNLNPPEFAQKFWTKEFTSYFDSAIEINSFIKMMKEDFNGTVQKYSRVNGIGNNFHFLVKGEGVVTAVNEDNVVVAAKSGTEDVDVKLSTGIYFGNAVRDITGKISMGDFLNTMDYNRVSSELNKIVYTQVVLPFKSKAAKGTTVQFFGAMEISKGGETVGNGQILPLRIELDNK